LSFDCEDAGFERERDAEVAGEEAPELFRAALVRRFEADPDRFVVAARFVVVPLELLRAREVLEEPLRDLVVVAMNPSVDRCT
jgi:hypothetical protein